MRALNIARCPTPTPAISILIPGLLCDANVWQPPDRRAFRHRRRSRLPITALQDSLPGMARTILAERAAALRARRALDGRAHRARGVSRRARARDGAGAVGHRLPSACARRGRREGSRRAPRAAGHRAPRRHARDGPQVGAGHGASVAPRRSARSSTPMLDMFESKTPDIYAAQIRALLNRPDGDAVLPTIQCPTLVLCGHEDSWSPPAAAPGDRGARFPAARSWTSPSAGTCRRWSGQAVNARCARGSDCDRAPRALGLTGGAHAGRASAAR